MQIRAFSKINLILEILEKRSDGYHELRSVMQSLALHDCLEIKIDGKMPFELICNDPNLPTDHRNLVTRAATYMIETFNITKPIRIDLTKRIPQGAGLGGGSSDCAAALIGINELFDLKIHQQNLLKIGQQFGADVPFCVLGGTALAEGIGEKLTPLPPLPHCFVVLACQKSEVSTREVFTNWKPSIKNTSKIPTMIKAIENNDLTKIATNLYNDLTVITNKKYNIQQLIEEMIKTGAINATMSGSGPTVFGFFSQQETAKKAHAHMESITGRAFLTEIVNSK